MTDLLQQAFEEAAAMPDEDQDRFARWLLQEIHSEREWDRAFQASQEQLERLADAALAEHRQGLTEPLSAQNP